MKVIRHLPLSIAAAAVSISAAHAQTLVGPLYQHSNQVAMLTGPISGATVDLATNVYFDSADDLYTYQYNLTNNGDTDGISTITASVSGASDYGTTGLSFFFGGAVNGSNQVAVDDYNSVIGNTNTNASSASEIDNGNMSLSAYNHNGRIDFGTTSTPIENGQSNASQASLDNDYLYIQSASAPEPTSFNVSDSDSADFFAPGPNVAAVPEPGSLSLIGVGALGILAAGLRSRKSRAAAL